MVLHNYVSDSGRDLILEYIDSLSEEERIDGLSVLECMENGEFDKPEAKEPDREERQKDSHKTGKRAWKSIRERFHIDWRLSICHLLKWI